MIWTILFVFTFTIAVLNMFKVISILFNRSIELPGILKFKKTAPEQWYIFYSCFFYQTWFWFDYLGLFSQI